MLRVGLTGGIGSGKSAFAEMLRGLGAHVSSSDEVGRRLMQPGEDVFASIVECFGSEVLTADGTLDRRALARMAFSEGRAEELNSIVHPAVIAAQAEWMETVAALDPVAVAVLESALIFETRHGATGEDAAPWRTRFDRIILVTAPIADRRARFAARSEQNDPTANPSAFAQDFDRRSAAQWTDEKKAALSDIVVLNEGTLHDLQAEAERVFATLRTESTDRADDSM